MIKMIALLKRKDSLTHAQFVKHWREVHGPLAHAVPQIRRYVQSHIASTASRPDIPDLPVDVDGIAELWFDDMQALNAAAASDAMQRLLADGATIIGEIKTFLVNEELVIPKDGARG